MYATGFLDHWADLLVAGIVLEMAVLGWGHGLFRGVVLGMQSIASLVLALSLSGHLAARLVDVGIQSTAALGGSFLFVLAVVAVGFHVALQKLIAGRTARLPTLIDKIGGGLAGGLAGVSFAGAILIAFSMLPMPAAMRINTNGMALDAGSKMLRTFARCLDINPQARDRLLDKYRLAAWNRPSEPAVPEPTPEPMSEPMSKTLPKKNGQNDTDASSITFRWGSIPLKDLSHWKEEGGEWSITKAPKDVASKAGNSSRIRGRGNSRLTLRYPLPSNVTISFKMLVREGSMRPAVFLKGTGVDVWIGNSGVGHTLFLQGSIEPKRAIKPLRYSFNEVYDVRLALVGQRATLRINAQEISVATLTEPREEASDALWLTLSSGDALAPGEAEFWDLRIWNPIADETTAGP
jgi:uncharacterized membrane protein required for colicin V production